MVSTLAILGGERASASLLAAAVDPARPLAVRERAVEGLAYQPHRDAAQGLERLAADPTQPRSLRLAAVRALGQAVAQGRAAARAALERLAGGPSSAAEVSAARQQLARG